MVDEILLSPEEQDERAKKWLQDNALSLVIGIAIGVSVIFGVNHYRSQAKLNSEQASEIYTEIMSNYTTDQKAKIEVLVKKLKVQYAKTPYAAKATLLRAKQLVENNLEAAAKELEWVIDNASEVSLQHAARLRLARVYIEQNKTPEASQLVNDQAYDGYDSFYHEVIGDIAVKQQDFMKAKQHFLKAIERLSSNEANYAEILTLKINQLPELGE